MRVVLEHPDANVAVETVDGRRAISVEPKGGLFVLRTNWTTSYPLELIEQILRVKGPAFLCDEIMRDENPADVEHVLHWSILSYVDKDAFSGKRVLDFGSGCGASSMVLSRMFPDASIVGVELLPEFVDVARRRALYHGVNDRVSFHLSPAADRLPPDIGEFDHIVLSAVYEHLLPPERTAMLELMWRHLKPAGILYLNGTPHRWFPVESHTTHLPLLNYLPDRLALYCARRFCRRVSRDEAWAQLLRRGIRGGTPREILATLNRQRHTAELLSPGRLGVNDTIDIWCRLSPPASRGRQLAVSGIKMLKATTGLTVVPWLSLAIRKAG